VRNRILAIVAFAYAALGFTLSRIPLFDYLGYEFSATLTFAVALFTPFLIHRLPSEGFFRALGRSGMYHLLLLGIPLIEITLNAFLVRNCSYAEGVFFFLLFPCITLVFCTALMGWCHVVVRRPRLMYCGILAIVIIHPLVVGYVTPQIYSYNFIYGYFPGFSYDEVLTISPTMILFRLVTVVVALFFLSYAYIVLYRCGAGDSTYRKLASLFRTGEPFAIQLFTFTLFALLIVISLMRTSLGFESSSRHIQEVLGGRYRTEHFMIFYSSRSFSPDEIAQVGLEHEFRFHQVESALQLHFRGTIDSYIYPDAETKRTFIGTGTTNIAKPWRREIHLNKGSWYETLRHELVHVMAGEFGMPIIKAHYHTGLVEGLAMAIDDDYGNRTLHEYAAAVMKFGFIRNPEPLISPLGFAVHASSVSYVLMGSFCRYLLDRFGVVRFKELYGGAGVESVYGRSYEQLIREWQHALLRIEVPDGWYEHVAFYFNRQSIFARECARAIAKLNQKGWMELNENASVSAMGTFSRSLNKSWNTEGFGGYVRSAYQATLYDTVVASLNREWADSIRKASMINQLLIYGDALWELRDTVTALQAYRQLLALDLSDGYNDAAALRIEAITCSPLQQALLPFFTGSLDDSSSLANFGRLERTVVSPLLPYLKSRVLFRHARYEEAAMELDTLQPRFTVSALNAARFRLQAEIHFQLAEFQKARQYFWESLNYAGSQAAEQRIGDWLERCEWYESRKAGSQ